ncbi:hypothetical protein MRY87_09680, partial [bacterium]|nr:hypothetical protein [bacterium]
YHAPGVLSEKRLRLSRVRPREGQRRQLRREAAKLKEFELAFLRKVDAVFAPSPPTVERFQQLLPRVCVHELPAAVELAPFSGQHPGEGNTAFFVLFESSSEGCRQGLTWLLREVWPEVAERDATRVLIVFSQNEDARRYLPKALRELPGVSFESDQPEKHLNHSLAVLVPYFSDDVTHEAVRLAARAHRVALLPDEAAREMSLVDGKSCLVLERSEQDVSRWIFSLAREKGEALLSLGEALAAHLTQRHDPVQAAQQLFSVLSSATGGAESAASERGVLP